MTTLADRVSRLQVVLHAEEDLYRRMRGVLQREEEELIRLDPSVLEHTLAEKHALAEEGRLLEESRVALTRDLSTSLGLGSEPIKLSALIVALGDEAGELPAIHGRLAALVGSNQNLLADNDRFANRSLRRVKETLRMLGKTVPPDETYGPGSQRTRSAGRGRLLSAAI